MRDLFVEDFLGQCSQLHICEQRVSRNCPSNLNKAVPRYASLVFLSTRLLMGRKHINIQYKHFNTLYLFLYIYLHASFPDFTVPDLPAFSFPCPFQSAQSFAFACGTICSITLGRFPHKAGDHLYHMKLSPLGRISLL